MTAMPLSILVRRGTVTLPLKGYRGDASAAFPASLTDFLEIDDDGHVGFCYAIAQGICEFALGEVDRRMKLMSCLRGAALRHAADDLAAFVAAQHARHDEAGKQWSDHLDGMKARQAPGHAAERCS